MAGHDANLLDAALNALGLAVRGERGGAMLCDFDEHIYTYQRDGNLNWTFRPPADLSDFLKIRLFEYYCSPNSHKIVRNAFYGMSREELEIRLAVTGCNIWSGAGNNAKAC